MKIVQNDTAYDTAFLSRFMRAVYYRGGVDSQHKKWFKELKVEVDYCKTRNEIRWDFVTDVFTVGKQTRFRLRLPRVAITEREIASEVAEQLRGLLPREAPRLGVLAAELREALRMGRNSRPSNVVYTPLGKYEQEFNATHLPLRVAAPTVPNKHAVQQQRYAHVLELERKWLRRQKLVNTKLKKLKQKRRYYERQLEV